MEQIPRCPTCKRLVNYSIARLFEDDPLPKISRGDSVIRNLVANIIARDTDENTCIRLTDLIGEVAGLMHRDPKKISVQVRQVASDVGTLLTMNIAEGRRTFVSGKTQSA